MKIFLSPTLTCINPFPSIALEKIASWIHIDGETMHIKPPNLQHILKIGQEFGIEFDVSDVALTYHARFSTIAIEWLNPGFRIKFPGVDVPMVNKDPQWKKITRANRSGGWAYYVDTAFLLTQCIDISKQYGYHIDISKASWLDPIDKGECITKCEQFITPKPHQIDGVERFLAKDGRGTIADDAGLGKTITAGMIIKHYFDKGMIKRGIWVVPTIPLVYQTMEELRDKFGVDAFPITGKISRAKRIGLHERSEYLSHGFIIVTWSTFTKDWTKEYEQIRNVPFDIVVFDEMHRCQYGNKSYEASRNCGAQIRIGLTGTPMPNGNFEELYSILSVIDPTVIPPFLKYLSLKEKFTEHFINHPVEDERPDQSVSRCLNKVAIGELYHHLIRHDRSLLKDSLPTINETKVGITLEASENSVIEIMIEILSAIIEDWQFTQDYVAESAKNMIWQDLRRFSAYGGGTLRYRIDELFRGSKSVYGYIRMHHLKLLKELRELFSTGYGIRDYPKFTHVKDYLLEKDTSSNVLVFCDSVRTSIELGAYLHKFGFDTRVITGELNKTSLSREDGEEHGIETALTHYKDLFASMDQDWRLKDDEVQRLIGWFWYPYNAFSEILEEYDTYGMTINVRTNEGAWHVYVAPTDLMAAKTIDIQIQWTNTIPVAKRSAFFAYFDHVTDLATKTQITPDSLAKPLPTLSEWRITFALPKKRRILIATNKLEMGCNLQIARSILFFDYPMSIKQREQRLARIQRIGSPYSTIFLISFICGLEYAVERKLIEKYSHVSELGFADPNPIPMKEILKMMKLEKKRAKLVKPVSKGLDKFKV